MAQSKAAKVRELLLAGWSVSDAAREAGCHYSQAHGIAKKMAATKQDDKKAALKAGIKSTKPKAKRVKKAAVETPEQPTAWGSHDDDVDAGVCANCGYAIIERAIAYGGKSYGMALIHVGIRDNAEAWKAVERCEATREEDVEECEGDAA